MSAETGLLALSPSLKIIALTEAASTLLHGGELRIGSSLRDWAPTVRTADMTDGQRHHSQVLLEFVEENARKAGYPFKGSKRGGEVGGGGPNFVSGSLLTVDPETSLVEVVSIRHLIAEPVCGLPVHFVHVWPGERDGSTGDKVVARVLAAWLAATLGSSPLPAIVVAEDGDGDPDDLGHVVSVNESARRLLTEEVLSTVSGLGGGEGWSPTDEDEATLDGATLRSQPALDDLLPALGGSVPDVPSVFGVPGVFPLSLTFGVERGGCPLRGRFAAIDVTAGCTDDAPDGEFQQAWMGVLVLEAGDPPTVSSSSRRSKARSKKVRDRSRPSEEASAVSEAASASQSESLDPALLRSSSTTVPVSVPVSVTVTSEEEEETLDDDTVDSTTPPVPRLGSAGEPASPGKRKNRGWHSMLSSLGQSLRRSQAPPRAKDGPKSAFSLSPFRKTPRGSGLGNFEPEVAISVSNLQEE
jgi:hypothetical protein